MHNLCAVDFSCNGYEFYFEIEKIRLLYQKYNYAAKTVEVRNASTRAVVQTTIGPEVYGRDQEEARQAASAQARKWADSRDGQRDHVGDGVAR